MFDLFESICDNSIIFAIFAKMLNQVKFQVHEI